MTEEQILEQQVRIQTTLSMLHKKYEVTSLMNYIEGVHGQPLWYYSCGDYEVVSKGTSRKKLKKLLIVAMVCYEKELEAL